MTVSAPGFTGFPPDLLPFLQELSDNNNREWFVTHRDTYESVVLGPACTLVSAMGPVLHRRLGSHLRAEPRSGGSVLRVQRDARFARGAPYKPYLDLWFWEGLGPSRESPGFFVRISPDRLQVGAGMHRLPADRLTRFRECVDDPESGLALAALVVRLGRSGWSVAGQSLRRVPAPYPADHERGALLRHTGLYAEKDQEHPDELFTADLPEYLVERFRPVRHLHRWLVDLR
jgi:uncharacterized protein (TIGR02453 family)